MVGDVSDQAKNEQRNISLFGADFRRSISYPVSLLGFRLFVFSLWHSLFVLLSLTPNKHSEREITLT